MDDKKKCCIVIPIYKEYPSISEIASLKQAIKILNDYKFYLVCAHSLNTSEYVSILSQSNVIDYVIERFDNSYFLSLSGYNKLLISKLFYTRFLSFEFLLIYQLDAWVFKNDIEYWCDQRYDYIGAPWFNGFNVALEDSNFLGVGNGGFSLRRVKQHLRVLNSFKYIIPFKVSVGSFIYNIGFKSFFKFIKNVTFRNNTFHLFNNYEDQEDFFWGSVVSKRFSWFKVPDEKTASRFSMEVNAPVLYKMNNNKLPFGCHAWEKYNLDFWKEYIHV